MGIGKNIYINIEIHNYLNMIQDIDVTFCTQQAFDRFSIFIVEEFAPTLETPILQTISNSRLSKIWSSENWTKTLWNLHQEISPSTHQGGWWCCTTHFFVALYESEPIVRKQAFINVEFRPFRKIQDRWLHVFQFPLYPHNLVTIFPFKNFNNCPTSVFIVPMAGLNLLISNISTNVLQGPRKCILKLVICNRPG